MLTTESTAWAITFSAGLTGGVILGCGITPWAVTKVAIIATIAVAACMKLLASIRAERVA
jgi:hypothetical protein